MNVLPEYDKAAFCNCLQYMGSNSFVINVRNFIRKIQIGGVVIVELLLVILLLFLHISLKIRLKAEIKQYGDIKKLYRWKIKKRLFLLVRD